MAGPDSSYSALEIHIDWNVDIVRSARAGLPHHYPPSRRCVQCRMRLNRASLPRTVYGTGQVACS